MEQIEEMTRRQSGASCKYDWDSILDGSIWRLVQGEDFTCNPASLRVLVHKRSKERGHRAKVTMEENGNVVVQAVFNGN